MAVPPDYAYAALDVSGLTWEDNHVYVAANSLGLMVLQIDEEILPQPQTMLPLLSR